MILVSQIRLVTMRQIYVSRYESGAHEPSLRICLYNLLGSQRDDLLEADDEYIGTVSYQHAAAYHAVESILTLLYLV